MSLQTQPAAWHPIALHGTVGPGPSAKPQMPSAPGRPTLDPPQKGKPGGTGQPLLPPDSQRQPPETAAEDLRPLTAHLPLGIRLD